MPPPGFAAALQRRMAAAAAAASAAAGQGGDGHPRSGKSGQRGVTLHKRTKRFEGHIWTDKKQVYLGAYDVPEQAGCAHDIMALKTKPSVRPEDLNFAPSSYAELEPFLQQMAQAEVVSALRDFSKSTAARIASSAAPAARTRKRPAPASSATVSISSSTQEGPEAGGGDGAGGGNAVTSSQRPAAAQHAAAQLASLPLLSPAVATRAVQELANIQLAAELHEVAPLGLHASLEIATAAYDAAKLLAALQLGRDPAAMKLHRAATTYTAHPLWQQLLPGRCSFEEACSLLAHGLAAGLLAPAAEAVVHLQAAQAAAAAAAQPLQAGDVLALRSGPSPSLSIWPAGSAEAQAFEEFEQTARRKALRGSLRAAAAPASNRASSGAGSSELEAGDVLSIRSGPSPSIAIWPADSAEAEALMQFERTSTARFLRGGLQAAPEPASSRAPGSELPPRDIVLTTQDGRQHHCSLVKYESSHSCNLRGTTGMLHDLGAEAGDRLDFLPAGLGRAGVLLVKAAAEQAAGQAGTEAAFVAAEQQQQQEDSPESGNDGPGLAGAPLPKAAAVEADEGQLWMAIAAALGRLEAQGAPPAAVRGYRLALMGMDSDRWRLAHYSLLRAFELRGTWQQAAAWMGQAARHLRSQVQQAVA
ncbi:hypothetical protein ABPG75_009677 [Micractinium tetrahymenae]